MARTVENIIEIGRDLALAKERLGHGNFLAWIDAEFGMSDQAKGLIELPDIKYEGKGGLILKIAPSFIVQHTAFVSGRTHSNNSSLYYTNQTLAEFLGWLHGEPICIAMIEVVP